MEMHTERKEKIFSYLENAAGWKRDEMGVAKIVYAIHKGQETEKNEIKIQERKIKGEYYIECSFRDSTLISLPLEDNLLYEPGFPKNFNDIEAVAQALGACVDTFIKHAPISLGKLVLE